MRCGLCAVSYAQPNSYHIRATVRSCVCQVCAGHLHKLSIVCVCACDVGWRSYATLYALQWNFPFSTTYTSPKCRDTHNRNVSSSCDACLHVLLSSVVRTHEIGTRDTQLMRFAHFEHGCRLCSNPPCTVCTLRDRNCESRVLSRAWNVSRERTNRAMNININHSSIITITRIMVFLCNFRPMSWQFIGRDLPDNVFYLIYKNLKYNIRDLQAHLGAVSAPQHIDRMVVAALRNMPGISASGWCASACARYDSGMLIEYHRWIDMGCVCWVVFVENANRLNDREKCGVYACLYFFFSSV